MSNDITCEGDVLVNKPLGIAMIALETRTAPTSAMSTFRFLDFTVVTSDML